MITLISVYRRGAGKERNLMKNLNKKGFIVFRSAGSKNIDLIAGKNGRIYLIEVKYTSKDSIYLKIDEILEEINTAQKFGGKFLIAVKFSHKPWIFLDVEKFLEIANFRMNQGKRSVRIKEDEINSLPSIEILIDKNLNEFF